jgi:hypothetical protein
LTPESGIQYPRGVKGWAMGSVSIRATLHLRKALQGLAASGHPFRVSLRATAQARSPSGCRKCVPLADKYRPEHHETRLDLARVRREYHKNCGHRHRRMRKECGNQVRLAKQSQHESLCSFPRMVIGRLCP